MKKIEIGKRIVGDEQPCFIVAEVGVNHDGDINKGKQLIEVAAAAGADAVKFQSFAADRIVVKGAGKVPYQKSTANERESQYEMLRKLELTEEDFAELYRCANDCGIVFLSTPFDCESVEALHRLGVLAFKIGSGDINNTPLLARVAKKGRPIILSTGMSSLCEVEAALDVIEREGVTDVILLHCVSEYPCVPEHLNLRAMTTLGDAFGKGVGFSDHTIGLNMSLAAVALGACVIEKHITLDKSLPGPDHKSSLEPNELSELVQAIRDLEKALGDGIKRPTNAEKDIRKLVRKSVVARTDIPAMTAITKEMLDVKRPGNGIDPGSINMIVGKKSAIDIKKDTAIQWQDVT